MFGPVFMLFLDQTEGMNSPTVSAAGFQPTCECLG